MLERYEGAITFHALGLVPSLPASQGGCECLPNLILAPGPGQLLLYLCVACSFCQVQSANNRAHNHAVSIKHTACICSYTLSCFYELMSQTHQEDIGCWSHKDVDNRENAEPAGAALHLKQGEYLIAGGGDRTAPPSAGAGSGFLALKKLCMHNAISDLPMLAHTST